MSDKLIVCQGLSKAYGRKPALSGVEQPARPRAIRAALASARVFVCFTDVRLLSLDSRKRANHLCIIPPRRTVCKPFYRFSSS